MYSCFHQHFPLLFSPPTNNNLNQQQQQHDRCILSLSFSLSLFSVMADHKRKKKRGRSKLFRSCFRSFAVDSERPIINNNNNNKSDTRDSKTGRLGKPALIAPTGCGEDAVVVSDVNSDNRVSRLLKAVMVKKSRSSSKSSNASDINESFIPIEKTGKQSDDSNACSMQSTDMEDTSSRCSNTLSSSRTTSCSSSSTNANSRWLSEPKTSSQIDTTDSNNQTSSNSSAFPKPNRSNSSSQTCSILLPLSKSNTLIRSSSSPSYHKGLSQLDSVDSNNVMTSNPDKVKSSGNNWNIRWCLFLLMSLIVLVVYGRIYAILCTSILFYLVPCRRVKRMNSVGNASRVVDTESEQYKKRVIMAGLLDRTRNPLR
ncbi:hypothetical protein HanPSC8_Chr11g0460601 [Helianthus annuus]|nr:hypothetical protein HanLR1_Chr11g0392151 [Helianthus annuus]KAJ0874138.1 hypothetical protein HanPSC8_Chr11g0460601 [Helianthus annuus]